MFKSLVPEKPDLILKSLPSNSLKGKNEDSAEMRVTLFKTGFLKGKDEPFLIIALLINQIEPKKSSQIRFESLYFLI